MTRRPVSSRSPSRWALTALFAWWVLLLGSGLVWLELRGRENVRAGNGIVKIARDWEKKK